MKNITPYMMELHKELKDKRNIADITASQYVRTLFSLNSERPFKNLAWLKNVESVELRLHDYAPSTQKTMISTIVSTLSLMNQKSSYKKIFAYWYNRMMEKVDESKNKDSTVRTQKQNDNWLDWDVVLAHEKRLHDETEEIVKKKELTPVDWSTVLSYMVLSLYTKFAPRRNQDYQFMMVVKTEKQAKDSESNYFVLDTNKFIFNKYKTANSHGKQEFDVPKDLVDAIHLYLKVHPSSKTPFQFLVQYDGTPLPSVNSMTRVLNKIFGKNVGATMLRHIYLSSKYDVSEMNEDAEKMGHTSGMQHEYMKSQSVEVPEYKS
jgi:hypothetical protein